MKDILLQQKREKELILSKSYILREQLDFAFKFVESDIIKVITGPRRSGKSVLAFLLLKDRDFAYLNFDEEALCKIKDHNEISKGIFEVYPETRFILFDEIQNLQNWELFVSKLQRNGYNLILTGSNSKLLSKELSTALTGRHIPIEIFPFSFNEFLDAKGFKPHKNDIALPETKGKILNYMGQYLVSGSFPEVVVKNLEAKTYLDTLFDSVLLKDVVKRYNIRFPQKLYELSLYLVSNFSNQSSFTKLRNVLNFNSTNTVQNYIHYLEESYFVYLLNRFSFKVKEQIKTAKKTYLVDNGLILAKAFQFSPNIGRLMENLVFSELLKWGHTPNKSLFYYQTRNKKEVDFVLREGLNIKTLLQVFYQTTDAQTADREINALIEASGELNCGDLVIITWDKEGVETVRGNQIQFMPLWKWLTKRV